MPFRATVSWSGPASAKGQVPSVGCCLHAAVRCMAFGSDVIHFYSGKCLLRYFEQKFAIFLPTPVVCPGRSIATCWLSWGVGEGGGGVRG